MIERERERGRVLGNRAEDKDIRKTEIWMEKRYRAGGEARIKIEKETVTEIVQR